MLMERTDDTRLLRIEEKREKLELVKKYEFFATVITKGDERRRVKI